MTQLTTYGLERLEENLPAIEYGEAYRYKQIKRVMTYDNVRQASLYLDTHDYFILQLLFGHAFMIGILKYYEENEQYERCQKIKEAIEKINAITKQEFATNE